jgi:hypothetical protein
MKKSISVVILAVMFSAVGFAQSAKVIQVDESDVAKAKQLDDAVAAAESARREFREHIKQKYLQVKTESKDASCVTGWVVSSSGGISSTPQTFDSAKLTCAREGWYFGFEFSSDYKFIVPVAPPPPTPTTCFSQGTIRW